MKNLICLLFVSLVVLFSCSRDVLNDENLDLKKAIVPIPMKGEICMTYNYDVPLLPVDGTPYGPIPKLYLSGEAWLSGRTTHMGILSEESSMEGISAYLDMDALSKGKIVCVGVFEAKLVSMNGDYIIVMTQVRIDVTDQSQRLITGEWTISYGTGRYENMTGSGLLSGILPCWETDGTVEYPR